MDVLKLKAVLGLDSSEYTKGLKGAESDANSFGSAIGKGFKTVAKVGAAAIGAATTAATAFAAASVKTGADFDKSMSQVAATMGKTMDEMASETGKVDLAWGTFSGNLREYAQEMGRNTAFSATQAADALNYMALAGYTVQESMTMLPNVLNLAAAGNMDLARASDMVTDTQTAFGLKMEEMPQLIDEMAKAASTGNTSVEQLGDAFLTVGGLAQELNGGFVYLADGTEKSVSGVQELEIALTAMANAGIKGSEAGTHMRNMLLKLSSPTDDGTKALEAMGVAVFDTEGQMRSLADIFVDLGNAMGTMTQEEKISTISDLFNTRDIASAEALLNAVEQDWDKIGASILDAEGAAQKMADTQLDNLAGDVTLFKSALEGAQIAISDGLTPQLREFVQFGTSGLSKITDAFTKDGLTGAMGAFGEVLADGLNMVIGKLPSFIDAGMQLLGALGKGILDNLPVIIDATVQIANQLATGLVEAIPSLVDGAEQLVIGLVNGIARVAPTLIPQAVQTIMDLLINTLYNIPDIVKAALNLVQGLADGIINAIPVLIKAIPMLIQGLINGLIQAVPRLISGTIQLVMSIVNALPTIIKSLIDAIPSIISLLINGLLSALPQLIQGNIQLILALVQAMPMIIQSLVDAIPMIIQTITDALIANMPQLINGLIQLTIGIVKALPTIIGALIQAIPSVISMIVETIISLGPTIISAVIQILGAIGSTLLSMGATFVSNVGQTMGQILNTVVQWLSQLPEKMAYWAGYAIGSFIKFVMELPTKISNIFTTVISKVVSFGNNFSTKARETATAFLNNMINGIKNLPTNLWNIFTAVISKTAELASNLTNKATEIARNFTNGLINGISGLPSKFANIGSQIVNGLWSGIKGGWDWLTDKVSDLADSLFQGAKDALGIHSPSRKFMWIGQMIDEGFASGLDKFAYLVDDAISNIIPDVSEIAPQVAFARTNGVEFAEVGGYNQTINIYSPTALTPSEVARQTRNATRDMVLELRGRH